jgi:hypothetical protein
MGADNDSLGRDGPDRAGAPGGRTSCGGRLDLPVIPCANVNFPTLMLAEKVADSILAGD